MNEVKSCPWCKGPAEPLGGWDHTRCQDEVCPGHASWINIDAWNKRADSLESEALNYIATEKVYWLCEECNCFLRGSDVEIHEGVGEYPAESEYAQCPKCETELEELFAEQVATAVLENKATIATVRRKVK